MTMPPRVRKSALTTHVVCSVGWLGAVAGSLALAIAALATDDEQTMRGIYLALDVTGWFALVPLSLASLATGLIQGLGTKWGLFRYWWVVVKLIITVVAVIVLLMYTQTLGALADLAREPSAATGGGDAAVPVAGAARRGRAATAARHDDAGDLQTTGPHGVWSSPAAVVAPYRLAVRGCGERAVRSGPAGLPELCGSEGGLAVGRVRLTRPASTAGAPPLGAGVRR
jgi:hypothetical protein